MVIKFPRREIITYVHLPPSLHLLEGGGEGGGGGGGGDDYTQDRKSKRPKPEIIWDYRNKILWAFSVEIPDANTGWKFSIEESVELMSSRSF